MPIDWPDGWDRTPPSDRTRGPYQVDWSQAEQELVREIERAGGTTIAIDRELGASGRTSDPGVVVRWTQDGDAKVMACDEHTRKDANLRAIGLTIRDLRKSTTRGVIQEDRAFHGLDALPSGKATSPVVDRRSRSQPAHAILGVAPDAPPEIVETAARRLKKKHHPDSSEDPDKTRFNLVCKAEEAMLDG